MDRDNRLTLEEEHEYVLRATRAYYRMATEAGEIPQEPSSISGVDWHSKHRIENPDWTKR